MREWNRHVTALLGIAVAALGLMASPVVAEEDGSPVSIGTYRSLHSEVLDEQRTLLVNLPKGYDETDLHYPVLYVLYGGQVRGYFAETVHIADRLHEAGLIPRIIIVGVKNVDRYRDNLPISHSGEEGGAGKFLRFFTAELIPFIDGSYRTKDFRILLGPQAGASFGLYALMEEPGLFRANIITNPFWNRSVRDYFLTRSTEFFGTDDPLHAFLFITCNTSGDNEATMEYLDRFAGVVEEGGRSDFVLELNHLEGVEAGDWIPSPGLKKGLMAYFRDYKFPEGRPAAGLEDIRRYYRDLSGEYGYEVDIPEFALVDRGDALHRGGQPEEARLVYEYLVEHYPHNLNSYHRLAELESGMGNYERAIGYYEEFLRRRPEPMIEQRMNALRRYVEESAAHSVGKAIADAGVAAGVARYREIRAGGESGLYFDEREFNALGYTFLGRDMVEAAIAVFEMNVEMYPESANAYDSLAEAYLAGGDVDSAKDKYKRSLELNPENDNAREVLEKLGE